MVEGYTEYGDQVVVDDDDEVGVDETAEDDGDEPVRKPSHLEPDRPSKSPIEPIKEPSKPDYTDRTLYDFDRDDAGLIKSIDYKNGQSVEFAYDKDGNVTTIVDTASGTTMMKTSEGWQVVSANGEKRDIDGDVSVDQETGTITIAMKDGRTITNYPNGRSTMTDADGNLVAVHNPDQWVETPGGYLRSPVNATAKYDADGNLVQANDGHGNTYYRQEDGSWTRSSANIDASFTQGVLGEPYDGTVTIDPIRGVVATPNQYVPPEVTRGLPS